MGSNDSSGCTQHHRLYFMTIRSLDSTGSLCVALTSCHQETTGGGSPLASQGSCTKPPSVRPTRPLSNRFAGCWRKEGRPSWDSVERGNSYGITSSGGVPIPMIWGILCKGVIPHNPKPEIYQISAAPLLLQVDHLTQGNPLVKGLPPGSPSTCRSMV